MRLGDWGGAGRPRPCDDKGPYLSGLTQFAGGFCLAAAISIGYPPWRWGGNGPGAAGIVPKAPKIIVKG